MPLCSIITAAWSDHARFTAECWESIAGQRDLGEWEIEWCVQEDGAAPILLERLPSDERIRYDAAGVRHGIATTRNLALARARGEIVRVLDQDDVLLAFALRDQLRAFAEHREAAWVAGQADDLLPDGSRQTVRVDLPTGVVAPGVLVRSWTETGVFPIHAAGLGLRTEVARAFGGWAALPSGSEDVSLLTAVSSAFTGIHLPGTNFLYRRWPGQTTKTEIWKISRAAGQRAIRQRAQAVTNVLLNASPAPSPTPDTPIS